MKRLVKLSDVFAKNAGLLYMRADMGKPFSVLISDADKQATPESFETYAQANEKVSSLAQQGIDAAVAEARPFATKPKTDYRLYIRPTVRTAGGFCL